MALSLGGNVEGARTVGLGGVRHGLYDEDREPMFEERGGRKVRLTVFWHATQQFSELVVLTTGPPAMGRPLLALYSTRLKLSRWPSTST